jgi:hypothetical protein
MIAELSSPLNSLQKIKNHEYRAKTTKTYCKTIKNVLIMNQISINEAFSMKHGSTIFLRGVIIITGFIILALCLFALPVGLRSDASGFYRPIILGMYVAAVPFFIAVHQAFKLLGYIDHNKAFSQFSVNALKTIKQCAVAITALYAIGLPYIYMVADKDDAPGAMAMACIIILASLVFAVFAAVLQRLLQDALNIKTENDLTV